MPAAGDYRERFDWQRRTPGTPDAFGQRADGYASQGSLWGCVEDQSGGRTTAKESERQVITATLRLRNRPAVAAGDRLVSQQWGDVWTVEHVVRTSAAEITLQVTRPHWTAGGGTVA